MPMSTLNANFLIVPRGSSKAVTIVLVPRRVPTKTTQIFNPHNATLSRVQLDDIIDNIDERVLQISEWNEPTTTGSSGSSISRVVLLR